MIYRLLRVPHYPLFLNRKMAEELGCKGGPETDMILCPAILRVNRQIYSEASYIMYSEVTLATFPGDLVCLRPDSEDITLPSEPVWRHNPLDGIGAPGSHGGRIYSTPEMDGKMEPHVFSRFKQITLDFVLDLDPNRIVGCPEMKIAVDDCVKFQEFLLRTNIFRDFATVLSKSLQVKRLSIDLELWAWPNDHPDLPSDDEGNLPDVYFIAVDTRATEVFIESGVMDPLRKLSNIGLATVQVVSPWALGVQTLQPKYDEMMRDFEVGVGMNCFDLSDTTGSASPSIAKLEHE
jgi:hypothetical protein